MIDGVGAMCAGDVAYANAEDEEENKLVCVVVLMMLLIMVILFRVVFGFGETPS